MYRSYLISSLRNLAKNKVLTMINLVGLTLGMTVCMLIVIFVRDELNFDSFHEKADRVYRIKYEINGFFLAQVPPPLGLLMKDNIPEIEKMTRLFPRELSIEVPSQVDGLKRQFQESKVFFADSTVFDVFSFEFIGGNSLDPLSEPNTLVLNEETAKKYFGNQSALGQTLKLEGKYNFKVVAVVKDFPPNSHIHFDMLLPYDSMFDIEEEPKATIMRNSLTSNFLISHSYTYILSRPEVDIAQVDAKIAKLFKENVDQRAQRGQIFTLQPLLDIRLSKDEIGLEPETTSDIKYIYVASGIAFLTLLIACINFINLSTAASLKRAKEIGIRKVLGANRRQIMGQFFSQSVVFCLLSFFLSLFLVFLLLPLLNELTSKGMAFFEVVDLSVISYFLLVLIFTGLMAGSYPAFVVARFNMLLSLKGITFSTVRSKKWKRKVLVVFQFVVSGALIVSTLVIQQQLNYLQNEPLGFQKDHVVNIPIFSQSMNNIYGNTGSSINTRLNTYRNRLLQNPNIESVTMSDHVPGLGASYRPVVPDGFSSEDRLLAAMVSVDYDFIDTYKLNVIEGRSFSRSYARDVENSILINEKAAQTYNWPSPEDAIGKTIDLGNKKGQVIGVLKDFHVESLESPIDPLIVDVDTTQYAFISVRLTNTNVKSTTDFLREEWNALFSQKSFELRFLDERINEQYQRQADLSMIVSYFSVIAIFISCLGSYGLVMFTVQRKRKEIGIRKTLGASTFRLLYIFYTEFFLMVLTSYLIAFPVAYYLMGEWLSEFSYHKAMEVSTFMIAGLIVLVIVLITVSHQALKASLANPAVALRTD